MIFSGYNQVNHGATLCPIILGSNKTTVLVATGQNKYYPLYMSNGLIHNNVCQAHRNSITLVAFLVIPKSTLLLCPIPIIKLSLTSTHS